MAVLSPSQILKDQFRPRDPERKGNRHIDSTQVVLLVLGACVGVITPVLGLRLLDVGGLLAASSILTGVAFATSLSFWERSVKARRDPEIASNARNLTIIDTLSVGFFWSVLTGVVTAGVLAAASFVPKGSTPGWLAGVSAGLLCYQILMTFAAMIRFYLAGYELR